MDIRRRDLLYAIRRCVLAQPSRENAFSRCFDRSCCSASRKPNRLNGEWGEMPEGGVSSFLRIFTVSLIEFPQEYLPYLLTVGAVRTLSKGNDISSWQLRKQRRKLAPLRHQDYRRGWISVNNVFSVRSSADECYSQDSGERSSHNLDSFPRIKVQFLFFTNKLQKELIPLAVLHSPLEVCIIGFREAEQQLSQRAAREEIDVWEIPPLIPLVEILFCISQPRRQRVFLNLADIRDHLDRHVEVHLEQKNKQPMSQVFSPEIITYNDYKVPESIMERVVGPIKVYPSKYWDSHPVNVNEETSHIGCVFQNVLPAEPEVHQHI
ncbi:hypothetical protein AVEN_70275-1 [Araneus ventricosus]|uniref:Large T antigen polyomavirus C-terminal domain-containing protein n=1 Tax=Araneus ventricosus TaxID=182803 RepID=A0A4Y2NKG3_ARAVE|nr:hypothetical protein AVEN_70275-1 [Araneus ventricosus]